MRCGRFLPFIFFLFWRFFFPDILGGGKKNPNFFFWRLEKILKSGVLRGGLRERGNIIFCSKDGQSCVIDPYVSNWRWNKCYLTVWRTWLMPLSGISRYWIFLAAFLQSVNYGCRAALSGRGNLAGRPRGVMWDIVISREMIGQNLSVWITVSKRAMLASDSRSKRICKARSAFNSCWARLIAR